MNAGKKFETIFNKSVPEYCFKHRLKDSAQSFVENKVSRFSWENPCDFFVFDPKGKTLYCLELKSTKTKNISFENVKDLNPSNRMIHKHQIESLTKFSRYENVIAGFILNFRNEKNWTERTYFLDIRDFNKMCETLGKASLNEIDILSNSGLKILGIKKRTQYTWNLEDFFSRMRGFE